MKLLAISGALRKQSTNTMLLHEAVRVFGGNTTAKFADIRFPLYDGDLEEASGIPDSVTRVANEIQSADAVLISSPEYNSNLSGVLKNALDWLSRADKWILENKPLAIMSAGIGRTGGARGQFSLRSCLTPFRPDILQGPEVLLPDSRAAFDGEGRLTNEITLKNLTELMARLRQKAMRQGAIIEVAADEPFDAGRSSRQHLPVARNGARENVVDHHRRNGCDKAERPRKQRFRDARRDDR